MDISELPVGTVFYKVRVTNEGETVSHRCVIADFPKTRTLSGKRQFKYLEWYPNGTYERAWGKEDLFDKIVCDRYGRVAFSLADEISELKERFVEDSNVRLTKKEEALKTEQRWQEIFETLSDI